MNNKEIITADTQQLVTSFFRRNEIRSLEVEQGEGITAGIEISNVNLMLIKEHDRPDLDYMVDFKLQSESSDIFRYLKAIHTEPETSIDLAEDTGQSDDQLVNQQLRDFIRNISDRVKSARKEETVQNIKYVGNTFILNNATVFKVLSDEGEGRLTIEVLSEAQPMDAVLTASGLLDGLYLGSIKLVE